MKLIQNHSNHFQMQSTSNEKFNEIKQIYEKNANSKCAPKMASYMKNNFIFYGIPTPTRRLISKEWLKKEKESQIIDWDFLDKCYEDDHREIQYLALDYLNTMHDLLTFEDVPKLFKYVQNKQWWDTIDFLNRIIGNIGLKDKRIDDLMLEWSKNENFWVRRLSIIHQLLRKEKTNKELMEKIIVNNFGSDEFFINKAIGWCLRDYSKTNPKWVKNFISKYKDKMNKISLKEAKKYI